MDGPGPERIGRFKILSMLGSGGMGVVYLAEDPLFARQVALKVLRQGSSRDPELLLRFQQEARALSALNHPNIIRIYEIGYAEAGPFIVSEYFTGETLRKLLDRQRLELSRIIEISVQIAEALTAAHKAGIVHGDIKPGNIMIEADGHLKMLDFGLAMPVPTGTSGAPDTRVTGGISDEGMALGTVKYISPEQAHGLETDPRSDVFSFGVVMYEMATDRLPFQGGTAGDILRAILWEEPQPLNLHAPATHPEFQRILDRCLTKDRENRYAAACECLTDLRILRQQLANPRTIMGASPTG